MSLSSINRQSLAVAGGAAAAVAALALAVKLVGGWLSEPAQAQQQSARDGCAPPSRHSQPALVMLFCGKRKCGKDYVSQLLLDRLGQRTAIPVHLSAPLKKQFALDHNLDYEELLKSSAYKERYRLDMIRWGEEQRNRDPGFFCRLATADADPTKVWVVVDCRRPSDMEYFKTRFNCVTVRVKASEAVRKQRGWVYTAEVDDAESECALDNYPVDMVLNNDSTTGNTPALEQGMQKLFAMAVNAVHS